MRILDHFITVSALEHTAVETTPCYVFGIQIPVNSIEIGAQAPGDQSAGDKFNYLQLINTPTTRSYHRQISLRS
jgi:hypothetical protein